MSAISSFSLSLLSLHAQIHMHALQHRLPLFPLASPSCLLLWPDEPSLFICYYTGIVGSKNQEGACGVCQRCWLKVRVERRSSPLLSEPSFHSHSPPLSINFYLTRGNHAACPSVCALCVCICSQLTFCLPPSCLALWPPSLCYCIRGAFSSANED